MPKELKSLQYRSFRFSGAEQQIGGRDPVDMRYHMRCIDTLIGVLAQEAEGLSKVNGFIEDQSHFSVFSQTPSKVGKSRGVEANNLINRQVKRYFPIQASNHCSTKFLC